MTPHESPYSDKSEWNHISPGVHVAPIGYLLLLTRDARGISRTLHYLAWVFCLSFALGHLVIY